MDNGDGSVTGAFRRLWGDAYMLFDDIDGWLAATCPDDVRSSAADYVMGLTGLRSVMLGMAEDASPHADPMAGTYADAMRREADVAGRLEAMRGERDEARITIAASRLRMDEYDGLAPAMEGLYRRLDALDAALRELDETAVSTGAYGYAYAVQRDQLAHGITARRNRITGRAADLMPVIAMMDDARRVGTGIEDVLDAIILRYSRELGDIRARLANETPDADGPDTDRE